MHQLDLASLHQTGYLVLRNQIPAPQISALLRAARLLAARARTPSSAWPHLRTLPKQFPPWSADASAGIWGVQHLLHPDLPLSREEGRGAFAELYFGDEVLGPVGEILGGGCSRGARGGDGSDGGVGDGDADGGGGDEDDDGLVMELFNMLVTPDRDFALRWHRDDVSFDGMSLEDEAAALLRLQSPSFAMSSPSPSPSSPSSPTHLSRPTHTQYNIPLLPDSSLHLIPASHLRARTPTEAALLAADPCSDALPRWIAVTLQPGDVVFYDNNLIHRGVYGAGVERLTLHGSVGHVRAGDGAAGRARSVLQHGCGGQWVARCEFEGEGRVRKRAEGMRDRLVRLGGATKGDGEVGFVHGD